MRLLDGGPRHKHLAAIGSLSPNCWVPGISLLPNRFITLRNRLAFGSGEGGGLLLSSAIIWLAALTHWSQMNTLGPATNLATSASPLPQKEQANLRRLNISFHLLIIMHSLESSRLTPRISGAAT
jgi:hypothetical protein